MSDKFVEYSGKRFPLDEGMTLDDADEQDLRFYAVIGSLGDGQPSLCVRVGVYGHHWNVPANTVFDGLGPFRDEFGSFDAEGYVSQARLDHVAQHI